MGYRFETDDSELAQQLRGHGKFREVKTDTKPEIIKEEKKVDNFCPECGIVHTHAQAEKLTKEVESTKAALAAKEAEVAHAKQASEMTRASNAELERLQEVEKTFGVYLEHIRNPGSCTNPDGCSITQEIKAAWKPLADQAREEGKKQALASQTPEDVRQLMKQHRIEEFPKKIIFTGLTEKVLRR